MARSSPRRIRGGFQTMIRMLHPSYRLRHAAPQAIRSPATKNINAPTGKMAAMRIPAPSARAHTPISAPQSHRLILTPPLQQYMRGVFVLSKGPQPFENK